MKISDKIIVSSRPKAQDLLDNPDYKIGGLISLAGTEIEGLDWHHRPNNIHKAKKLLTLSFDDVTVIATAELIGLTVPNAEHIESILNFGRTLNLADDEHLLIHCAMGKSRSTAAALMLIAQEYGPGNEEAAVNFLPSVCLRNKIRPNILMINYADYALSAHGNLVQACEKFKDV